MPAAILDFVDAQSADCSELAMGQSPLDYPFHRIKDFLPTGPEASCCLFPRQLASPLRQEQHVGAGERVLAVGPRQRFDLHAAVTTVNAAHGIEEEHGKAPDRNKLEATLRERIVAAAGSVAA